MEGLTGFNYNLIKLPIKHSSLKWPHKTLLGKMFKLQKVDFCLLLYTLIFENVAVLRRLEKAII